MGDIADMMLDGTLCSSCGEFLGAEDDYPQMCPACAKANARAFGKLVVAAKAPKTNCEICNRRIKVAGVKDHMRDVHQVKP